MDEGACPACAAPSGSDASGAAGRRALSCVTGPAGLPKTAGSGMVVSVTVPLKIMHSIRVSRVVLRNGAGCAWWQARMVVKLDSLLNKFAGRCRWFILRQPGDGCYFKCT